MDFMIMMPLGPQLMRSLEINSQQFSLLVSAYTFSGAILSMMSAFILDRFDRKTALLFCFTGFTLGTLFCALSPTYELLLSARLVTGGFGGVLGALVLAIIGDVIPLERRGAAMGKVMAAFSAASVFGVPFGLYLASIYSWHYPFIVLAVSGLILFPLMLFYIPNMRGHLLKKLDRPSPLKIMQNVFQNSNQQLALTFMVVLMLGQFTIIPFISPYTVSNMGFSEIELTYVYLLGGGLTFFSSPMIGRISDRYGKKKVFTISILLSLIPILLLTNLGISPMWLVLLISSFFFVVMGGRMIPATTLITSSVKPENRGSFMSVNSAVQQLASGFSAYLAGLIIVDLPDGTLGNYNYVGYIACAASIACIFLVRKIKAVS